MKVGIDIDGVLASFDQAYKDTLIRVSGRELPTPFPPPVWDWELAAGYQPHEVSRAWQEISQDATFWENLPPIEGAHVLRERMPWANHDVYFITARPGYRSKHQTERWLRRVLGIDFPTVLVSKDKGPVVKGLKIDTLIDDKPANVIEAKLYYPPCRPYILTYPYNDDLHHPYRVSSVQEFLDKEKL